MGQFTIIQERDSVSAILIIFPIDGRWFALLHFRVEINIVTTVHMKERSSILGHIISGYLSTSHIQLEIICGWKERFISQSSSPDKKMSFLAG